MEGNAMTKEDQIIEFLSAFFEMRNIDLSPQAYAMWADALSDLSPEQIAFAIRRFNRESKDYPTIAGLRAFAGPSGLNDEERAEKAWNIVFASISKVGGYNSVNFDDPLINAAIREVFGSWVRLCDMSSDDLKNDWQSKKPFISAYLRVAKTASGDATPLAGISETQNAKNSVRPRKNLLVNVECPGLTQHPVAKKLLASVPQPQALPQSPSSPAANLAKALHFSPEVIDVDPVVQAKR